MATRNQMDIFGIGSAVTESDAFITGSRLPTSRQILRSVLFHLNDGASINRTKYEAAKIVYEQILPFYDKGGVPMLEEQTCCQKIVKLLEENVKLRRIPKARRKTESVIIKLNDYNENISKTFPLWVKNAENVIQNVEDLAFLKSMKTDRKATIAGVDSVTLTKLKRKEEKLQNNEKRRKISDAETKEMFSTRTLESSTSEESEGENVNFTQRPTTPKSHKRTKRTGTEAFVPHDILKSPRLVSLAARIKMTPAEQAAYTKAFVDEIGGDVSKISSSYSFADESRRNVSKNIAKEYKELWIAPKFASVFWDGKSLPTLTNKYEHQERLAILVGDSREPPKLLGIPAYKSGTDEEAGKIISRATAQLLTEWNCSDSIVNMVFDTTSSNTGHLTAACISIQNRLDRALLWSACSHHVGEVVITHEFNDLRIESSKSPETSVFTRLRKHWEHIPHDTEQELYTIDTTAFSDEAQQHILKWKADVLELFNSTIDFVREDYKEFLNLCVTYLNITPNTKIKFRRPGATHKARWMAKVIYALKLILLKRQIAQLPKGTITTVSQVPKLTHLVNFVALIYVTYWFHCRKAVDAPWTSLTFYQNILKYKSNRLTSLFQKVRNEPSNATFGICLLNFYH